MGAFYDEIPNDSVIEWLKSVGLRKTPPRRPPPPPLSRQSCGNLGIPEVDHAR